MKRVWVLCLFGLAGLVAGKPSPGLAQVGQPAAALPPADVEQLDSTSAAHLENAKRFLAEGQWEQAVESIRRVQETDADQLVKVSDSRWPAGFERYVPAQEYCQWRLAALATEAPPALAHYRRLVDSLAERWYREGIEKRDRARLALVVEKAIASSWGDDALLALGELDLAAGRPIEALAAWKRIHPSVAATKNDQVTPALATGWTYPDSDIPAADVLARQAVALALMGSLPTAQAELDLLRQNSPEATGTLAGRSGKYVDLLGGLLAEARQWPPLVPVAGWNALGGNLERNKQAAGTIDPAGRPLWSFPLPKLRAERELLGAARLRVAEDASGLLSYHPVVAGNQVLVRCDARGNSYVIALNLKTGEELWRVDFRRAAGEADAEETDDEGPPEIGDAHADLTRHVGVARYTISIDGERAFVRMGSPVTTPSARRMDRWLAKDQGFLLGLNLPAQGKPLEGFPIRPESAAWSFEGAPISDGAQMFALMRRSDGARSGIFVAAYELLTTAVAVDDKDDDARPAGRQRWRTRVASATLFGSENDDSLSHLLLTLRDDKLFVNTSAGVVAAIRAADGQLLWALKYPRTGPGGGHPDRDERHVFRDLTPCLAWNELVVVAPADCDRLFAVRAATGELAWTLPPEAAADAIHLLGANQNSVIASGDRLYWIDAETGRLTCQFPPGGSFGAGQAAPSPRGYGRGVLAGSHVYFPTRESILVFDQRPVKTDFGWQPRLVREIPLAPRGIAGGNLVIADGVLLIASADRLVALAE